MDRYEQKAREIMDACGTDAVFIRPRMVAAILRACDEMRAAGSGDKPVAGRPVAGEWRDGISGWGRYVGVGEMVTYADGGEWHVYRTDSSRIYREGRAPNEAAAMAAADAWAREHASELDWQLPPAAAPVTERELTDRLLAALREIKEVAETAPGEYERAGNPAPHVHALFDVRGLIDEALSADPAAIRSRTAPPVTGETTPTLDEMLCALVKGGALLVNESRLVALLSTLSPAARREALAAIRGDK